MARTAALLAATAAMCLGGAARVFARRAPHDQHTDGVVVLVVDGDRRHDGLRRRLDMSTEYFVVPSSSAIPVIPPEDPVDPTASAVGSAFRDEAWTVPVLALSAVTMTLIAGFEVFVLCKAWRTSPSRRHLFLGQMLLLGLFGCAALGAVLAASPTPATCAAVRFGAGVAYAVVFASLLVKCVFLISLNGGVYLPAPYQGLLLLFAVLIQVAIGAQWLLTSPPRVRDVAEAPGGVNVTLCRTPFSDVLCSLVYVALLLVFVCFLAAKSRGIRDNYREATYIALSVACAVPIWLAWSLGGLLVAERHRDACLAFGLLATSAVVFLVMFMPKGRQLAAMGKDGVFLEDREDRFSSLSRAASGYSPSFFHFKPVKCAAATPVTASKHQTGTANAATVTTLGADRAALYPAPPSYTRMYHYYPSPQCYYPARYLPGGLFIRPDDGNVYTTLEPTLSSNPNVYFQRGNGLHPGMMY